MCANRVNAYGMTMTEHTHPIRGSTAAPPPPPVPRRRLGTALRAVGVFAGTAFRVVILGADGIEQSRDTETATGRR